MFRVRDACCMPSAPHSCLLQPAGTPRGRKASSGKKPRSSGKKPKSSGKTKRKILSDDEEDDDSAFDSDF